MNESKFWINDTTQVNLLALLLDVDEDEHNAVITLHLSDDIDSSDSDLVRYIDNYLEGLQR